MIKPERVIAEDELGCLIDTDWMHQDDAVFQLRAHGFPGAAQKIAKLSGQDWEDFVIWEL